MSSSTTSTRTRLQELRESAGLTQTQLAKKCKVSQAAISAFEVGARTPGGETAKKIVTVLNRELKLNLRNWDVFPHIFKDPATIVGQKETADD